MFNSLTSTLFRNGTDSNSTDEPDDQAAHSSSRPGIRVADITPEPGTPEPRVIETGFSWIQLLLAGVGGSLLGALLLAGILMYIGPQQLLALTLAGVVG